MRQYFTKDSEGTLVEVLPINAFASLCSITLPTARDCCNRTEPGDYGASLRRPLIHFRDGSSIWVSSKELLGYPFIRGSNVYHYRKNEEGEYERYLCTDCTFGKECKASKEAKEIKL